MQKLLSTTLLLLLPMFAAAQTTQPITLDEAIQIALDNNYQLEQATNNLALSDTDIFSAKADFLPSLNGGFNGNRQAGLDFIPEDGVFEDRVRYGMSGSISTNVTIFSGFRNIMNLRRSMANRSSQKEDYERLRETIIFTTASNYLEVVLNKELLKIAESALEASSRQLEQVAAQVEVGARPTVDLYNQEAIVANDELTVIQRENALSVSVARLLRVMQDSSIQDVEVNMPSPEEMNLLPSELNLNEMIEAALENRSDFSAQKYVIESNENSVRIARANLIPSISASASLSGNYSDQYTLLGETVNFSDQFFDQSVRRSIGFSVSIPIFNNWDNRTSIQSAQIQLKNSRLELENIRFQISEEVRQAYNDYQSIVKELQSTEKSLIAAERAYETEQQRYEVGSTTLIELSQANNTYVEAQSNRIQAMYNFIFQEKLLDYYIGQLNQNIDF